MSVNEILLAAGGALIMAAVGALLINIQNRKAEASVNPQIIPISADELDPAIWGQNYPRQYDTFIKTQDDTISTPFGGSVKYSKLERVPAMVRIWAGYAFSKDHNEERGHYYKLTDQLETQRIELVDQRHKLQRLLAAVEPVVQVVCRQCTRLAGKPAYRSEPEIDQSKATQRYHDGAADRRDQQGDREPMQKQVVCLDVQRQLDAQRL